MQEGGVASLVSEVGSARNGGGAREGWGGARWGWGRGSRGMGAGLEGNGGRAREGWAGLDGNGAGLERDEAGLAVTQRGGKACLTSGLPLPSSGLIWLPSRGRVLEGRPPFHFSKGCLPSA